MQKMLSFITLFSLFLNLVLPYAAVSAVYAQEVSLAPAAETVSEPAPENTPAPDTSTETAPVTPPASPSETPSTEPTIAPTPTSTPVPSISPTPTPGQTPLPEDLPASPSALPIDKPVDPVSSAIPTDRVWNDLGDKTFETISNVELNKEYTAEQNDKVKVKFTKLPDGSGKLTIKEIKLSPEKVTQLNAVSDTAFEITSTMADNTFEYDLTLPLPPEVKDKDVEVKAAETEAELPSAPKLDEPKEKLAETITIKGLNHFTVFVITLPSPDTAQRVLINEILPNPTAGAEWVELFNNGTQPVNLAAGTGWTIRNSASDAQSLSALGTIPAAGRVVFEAPANWLSNVAPETVTLSNELGTAVDTVTISLVAPGFAIDHYPLAGESVGRKTDGVAEWVIFTAPTKGTANLLPATGGAGKLAEVGPIAPAGGLRAGFPVWYKDSNGLALDLMEAADPRGISDPVDPGNPFSAQIGFNAEGFWWSAEADMSTSGPNGALLVQAIEAAFAGEAAVDGEQSAFARARIRIDVAEPGTYTVTYPYGTKTYTVALADIGPGYEINDTADIGCFAIPGVLNCASATQPNFSTVLNGGIGPFLTWDTFNTNPALSDPLLTDPITGRRYVGSVLGGPHVVKGSPTGNNFFRIAGPNIGGPGVNVVETNLFTVTGRLADATGPVITLHGANPVNVNQNAVYTDAGATALDDQDGNITANIQVTGLPVDTSTLGSKTVTYTVTDSAGHTTTATRTVNVVAVGGIDITAPVITVTGANPATVTAGTPYNDAGATALDNVDGDITANIVTTGLPINTSAPGSFAVTYTVSDAAGNPATAARTVNVVADIIPPVITVLGSNPVNVLVGAAYTDAGATAVDNVDGNVTVNITTTGLPINTAAAGSFAVTYNVTDAAGNTATATRTVNVAATLPAGLVEVGPVAPAGGLRAGFPVWYKDSNGLALELMEAADPNGISAAVDPGNPFSAQIGFGAEGFWWSADASISTSGPNGAILVQAVEAAFAGEAAVDGEQSAFARVRIRIDVAEPGSYTVTFPYGTKTYVVDAVGAGFEINDTSDIGCFAQIGVASCNQATPPNFSTVLAGQIGPFLTWDTFNTNPALSDPILTNIATGRRYVGIPVPHAVKGSPTGNNFFRIAGPNIGGPGVNVVETNLFDVTGRIADVTPPVITLNGANPDTVVQNAVYVDPGSIALDDFDGNVTGSIVTTGVPVDTSIVGAKTVTYTVTDIAGNTAVATRTVNVTGVDNTAPVITLLGTSPVDVTVGTAYVDAGATALDNVDGDLTASIVTVNPVNSNVIGTYTVTYNVSDAAGNPAIEVTRTVNVVATTDVTPPVFSAISASSNNANPALGKSGDVVTVSFVTSEPLSANPTVTIGGGAMTFVSLAGSTYTFNRTLDGTEIESGQISITGSDAAGNPGANNTATFALDFALPTGSIAINGGALYTTTTAVILNFSGVSADVTQIQLRNGTVGAFQTAIPFENPHAYVLPNTQGVRVVSVRFIDAAGNQSTGVISDDITFDNVAPTDPLDVVSTSHTANVSTDNTIDMAWSAAGAPLGANDLVSGVAGYSYSFTQGATDLPDTTVDLPSTALGVTSEALTNGTWFFHLRTLDNAGSWTSTVHVGPFNIDVVVPTTGTISGLVFQDTNANRTKDAGEPVLPGWTLYLDANNNRVLDAGEVLIVSDAAGNYQFAGLLPGTYNINEVKQPNWGIRLPGDNGYTQILAAGDNITGKDFGNIVTRSVSGQGQGGFATTTGTTLTPSVVSVGDSVIDVPSNGGTSKVTVPADTIITESTGAVFDSAALAASDPAGAVISGLGTGVVVRGKLQWGVPNLGLVFSNPINLEIFVGTDLNGQVLDILRSVEGTTNWTSDGIVPPGKCTVANGICAFQATKASYYIAAQTVSPTPTPTPTPASATTSGGGDSGSGGGSASAPSCNDPVAGGAPTLLSATVSGDNQVTLTWSKAADPVTHYVVAYGLSAGNPQFGNPNVGGKETTSYTVKDLSGGTTYFFRVRAGNGCNAGPYSNEISATPGGRQTTGPAAGFQAGVLGASTSLGEGTGGADPNNPDAPDAGKGEDAVTEGISDILGADQKVSDKPNQSFGGFLNTQRAIIGVLLLFVALFAANAYRLRARRRS